MKKALNRAPKKAPKSELEVEARAFVARYAKVHGLDPNELWRDNHQKLLKCSAEWFVRVREAQRRLEADYQASRKPGQNSPPLIQWPGVKTPPPPDPVYVSFVDYLARVPYKEITEKCRNAAKKANRERLMSLPPEHRISREDVLNVMVAARGRCRYCGSLAVEKRPSRPDGAPDRWAQIGRRCGSLDHSTWRAYGGDNDLSNLGWSCLWCNTWVSERKKRAKDHGGFYPPRDKVAAIKILVKSLPTRRVAATPSPASLLRRQLKKARAKEDWEAWQEAAMELIDLGHELTSADSIMLSEMTEPDGPETYCIDEDMLYFGPGGRAWRD